MNEDLFSLSERVIVVTGACGLLGRQHVEAIAAYGGTPIILDLQGTGVTEFADEIKKKYGVPALGFEVDITDEDQIKRNSSALLGIYGRIDGLINNAANNPKVENTDLNYSRIENFPLKHWDQDISIGLTGAFLCIKYFGSAIAKTSRCGSIINISSDLGLISPDQRLYRNESTPEAFQSVKPVTYSIVKTGIIGLTRYVSTYWPTKVRCNAICPGGVEAPGQPVSFLDEVVKRIPMNRLASKNEYQGIIVFLLSDASSYMTGSVIAIDGGRTVW